MSDTPRTDAVASQYIYLEDIGDEFVKADFARQLERDLANRKEVLNEKLAILRKRDKELAESQATLSRTTTRLNFFRSRVNMLQKEQSRMRDPERTLVCDILANCQLLPDPTGERYGPPPLTQESLVKQMGDAAIDMMAGHGGM